MIEHNELSSVLIVEPGRPPRVRVHAGPGWVAGEHGQDVLKGAMLLCAQHGGVWEEVGEALPGAWLARCTRLKCKWTSRVLLGATRPERCEGCASKRPDADPVPVVLEPLAEAGVVLVFEQTEPPGKAWLAHQAFLLAPPRTVASAACAWACALLQELGVSESAARSVVAEHVAPLKRAERAELERAVLSCVEQHTPAKRSKSSNKSANKRTRKSS